MANAFSGKNWKPLVLKLQKASQVFFHRTVEPRYTQWSSNSRELGSSGKPVREKLLIEPEGVLWFLSTQKQIVLSTQALTKSFWHEACPDTPGGSQIETLHTSFGKSLSRPMSSVVDTVGPFPHLPPCDSFIATKVPVLPQKAMVLPQFLISP